MICQTKLETTCRQFAEIIKSFWNKTANWRIFVANSFNGEEDNAVCVLGVIFSGYSDDDLIQPISTDIAQSLTKNFTCLETRGHAWNLRL